MSYNFLPENYEAPKSGGSWMKIQAGENKIRILSQPILGWEDWTLDKKPVRFKFDQRPEKSINPKTPIKHFWSFVVWNYAEEKIQILHITQAGIRKGIEALCKDADWGAPFFYDIKIFKEGEEMKTKYMVNPLPHKPVNKLIIEAFNEKRCCLESLFTGKDPFDLSNKPYVEGIFSNDQLQVKDEDEDEDKPTSKEMITREQYLEIDQILGQCDPAYVEVVKQSLIKSKIPSLDKLPLDLFKRLKLAALKKMAEYKSKKEPDWFEEEIAQ